MSTGARKHVSDMSNAELHDEAVELENVIAWATARRASVTVELEGRERLARARKPDLPPVVHMPAELMKLRLPPDLDSWGSANEARPATTTAVDASPGVSTSNAPIAIPGAPAGGVPSKKKGRGKRR